MKNVAPRSLGAIVRAFKSAVRYRALYPFDKAQLVVHFIRHHREVYKTK